MTERAYTVSEIDRMRKVCRIKTRADVWRSGYVNEIRDEQAKAGAAAEDMVRTYMLGGVEPTELEATLEKCSDCDSGWVKEVFSPTQTISKSCWKCGGTGFMERS